MVLVGAESERPYERPALSKQYLQGKSAVDTLFVHDEGFYDDHDIELLTDTTVTAVDAAAAEIVTDAGERLRYDRLLLATGAAARPLSVRGADLDGVLYLRDLRDVEEIRRRTGLGGKALIVGAGWIGSEVAASLRETGLDVTVLEPAAVPLARVLGPEVGGIYADLPWDCACHGSRFGVDGDVLHGPATRPLKVEQISLEATPSGGETA